jgi:hypothetical protein
MGHARPQLMFIPYIKFHVFSSKVFQDGHMNGFGLLHEISVVSLVMYMKDNITISLAVATVL